METVLTEVALAILFILAVIMYVRIYWIATRVERVSDILEDFHNYFVEGFTIVTEEEIQEMAHPDNHEEIAAWDNADAK